MIGQRWHARSGTTASSGRSAVDAPGVVTPRCGGDPRHAGAIREPLVRCAAAPRAEPRLLRRRGRGRVPEHRPGDPRGRLRQLVRRVVDDRRAGVTRRHPAAPPSGGVPGRPGAFGINTAFPPRAGRPGQVPDGFCQEDDSGRRGRSYSHTTALAVSGTAQGPQRHPASPGTTGRPTASRAPGVLAHAAPPLREQPRVLYPRAIGDSGCPCYREVRPYTGSPSGDEPLETRIAA